jgi:ATP-binding protein involved in chromosome partitioning
MGLLVDSGAVVWRGPLVMSALQKLLKGAIWGPLDILIVDTPPGTGDVHLSLSQNVPLSGVILVSTPQNTALKVTKRGADMYKILKVPILGIVENMSYIVCEKCGTSNHLYNNIIQEFSDTEGIPILGQIPIEKQIVSCCEEGTPSCLKFPDSEFTKQYRNISRKLIEFLDGQEEIRNKSSNT